MAQAPIKHFLFTFLLVLLSNCVFSQHDFTFVTSSSTANTVPVRFKGVFFIDEKISYGTYNIFQIRPLDTVEMHSWLYSVLFGDNKEDIKTCTFTLITCKDHEPDFFKVLKKGDTLKLKVKTPDYGWILYGCFYDDKARQQLTLPCGCKRSIPFDIIETQVLVVDE